MIETREREYHFSVRGKQKCERRISGGWYREQRTANAGTRYIHFAEVSFPSGLLHFGIFITFSRLWHRGSFVTRGTRGKWKIASGRENEREKREGTSSHLPRRFFVSRIATFCYCTYHTVSASYNFSILLYNTVRWHKNLEFRFNYLLPGTWYWYWYRYHQKRTKWCQLYRTLSFVSPHSVLYQVPYQEASLGGVAICNLVECSLGPRSEFPVGCKKLLEWRGDTIYRSINPSLFRFEFRLRGLRRSGASFRTGFSHL